MKKFGYVMLVILCLGAHPARSADDFNFGFLPAINLGVWSDSGSLSATTDACIESWNGGSTRNYRFTVSDDIGGSGFYLYRDGNGSNSGSDRIAVTLLTKDSISSDVFGEITPDSPISPRAGQTQGCSAGDNGVFRVDINASDLGAANSGSYEGRFSIQGEGGNGFSENDTTELNIYLSVQASSQPEVKISRLDDITAVRSAADTNDLVANEYFCVYSDGSGYTLSISSSVTSSGSFALQSGSGEVFPIDLLFADNVSGAGLQNAESGSVSGTGDADSADCSGADNAMIRLNASDSDLSSASSGSYSATLTLVVEPI